MRKTLLAAALLGLSTAAVAQTAPAPAGGASFEQWAAKARDRIMAADTDHDGKISKAEFDAAGGGMMHGPRRGDTEPAATGADAPKPNGGRMFDRFDANQDGFLDASEINALLARRFARMDANHDGMLTPDERHAMRGGNAPEQ